jgi:hypothetical protein
VNLLALLHARDILLEEISDLVEIQSIFIEAKLLRGRNIMQKERKKMLNSKVYTKKCVICGKEYKSISVRALTCGKECRNEYHRRKYRKKRSIKTCRNSTLDDVLGKAREAGVSYGKYVAMMEGTPKIWQGEE